MKTLTYTNRQGQSLTLRSKFSDQQAADALAKQTPTLSDRDQQFAVELVAAYALSRRNGGFLSDGRRYWLHKLAIQSEPKTATFLDASRILQMFATANQHLRRPAILLEIGGQTVKIYRAGDTSRYAGQIMIAAKGYGNGFYGRIDANGRFFEGPDCTDEIKGLLAKLADDPEKTAAEYGKLTGKCCFCGSGMTDERSVDVGYGPVCAQHFGLRWGSVAAREARKERGSGKSVCAK